AQHVRRAVTVGRPALVLLLPQPGGGSTQRRGVDVVMQDHAGAERPADVDRQLELADVDVGEVDGAEDGMDTQHGAPPESGGLLASSMLHGPRSNNARPGGGPHAAGWDRYGLTGAWAADCAAAASSFSISGFAISRPCSTTAEIFCVLWTSASGSASRRTRSAVLPGSMVPRSWKPKKRAGFTVAAWSAASGGRPDSTSSTSSSCRLKPA